MTAHISSYNDNLILKQEKENLSKTIYNNIKLSIYPETLAAYATPRKFIAVLGETNSGKTYEAFNRLASANSGVYLGPLRLLALEAFSRLNTEFGVPTSLITGEERRIVDGSRITASTIEMLDLNRFIEVAVIDEAQMLIDPERGWAWTQAILGANAHEVWILGSLAAEPAITALATKLNVPLEIRKKTRKNPLKVAPLPLATQAYASLRNAHAGDAFIVFSRRDALNLRDDFLSLGRKVSCIYGALSPEVRESEAQRFATGDTDILVATDAIGLGLNLPIQRVIFTTVHKFDGSNRTQIQAPLLQQVAGRAGRFGHINETGFVLGLTPAEHCVVVDLMNCKPNNLPTHGFMIAPSFSYINAIAQLSNSESLAQLLTMFHLHCDAGDNFFQPHIPEEQLLKATRLDKLQNLSLELRFVFSMAPMPTSHPEIDEVWLRWARLVNSAQSVPLDFLPKKPQLASLAEAETVVRLLAAYRWFGYRLSEFFTAHQTADKQLGLWISVVDAHIHSRRKQGVGGGALGLPSWYWPAK